MVGPNLGRAFAQYKLGSGLINHFPHFTSQIYCRLNPAMQYPLRGPLFSVWDGEFLTMCAGARYSRADGH